MDPYQHHGGVSLLTGWLPLTIEIVAVVAIVLVVARPSWRWWYLWVPVSGVVAALVVWIGYRFLASEGLASDPAPAALWWWVGATAFALTALIVGARRASWWRRGASVVAVIAAALAAGVVLNQWVGYFPTVQEAWAQVTAGPLPDQVDASALSGMRDKPMTHGAVVSVDVPSTTSHFTHRTEYVYLPPAWFAGNTPPSLPAIMMIAGEFNTPADWMRIGGVIPTIDAYAKAHDGQAPILVFPDVGGSFNNDTECVDGSRGNVATHLTDEVRPYVVDNFHASPAGANWGVVGWSMGGTCAVDLATMHPDEFSAFEDIAGDAAPSSGDKAQTISRLFGGNTAAYNAYDPMQVMARHGHYADTVGWFDETSTTRMHRWHGNHGKYGGHRPGNGTGLGGSDTMFVAPGTELAAAKQLCTEGQQVGITCSIHLRPGGHTWQFARASFTEALPTLAKAIGTPDSTGAAGNYSDAGRGGPAGSVAAGGAAANSGAAS